MEQVVDPEHLSTLYPVTPTLSVEAVQDRLIREEEIAEAERLVGAEGGVVSRDNTNVAVTVVLAESVTTQVPVPEQPPPDQPEKVDPVAAAAVRVTAVPEL